MIYVRIIVRILGDIAAGCLLSVVWALPQTEQDLLAGIAERYRSLSIYEFGPEYNFRQIPRGESLLAFYHQTQRLFMARADRPISAIPAEKSWFGRELPRANIRRRFLHQPLRFI